MCILSRWGLIGCVFLYVCLIFLVLPHTNAVLLPLVLGSALRLNFADILDAWALALLAPVHAVNDYMGNNASEVPVPAGGIQWGVPHDPSTVIAPGLVELITGARAGASSAPDRGALHQNPPGVLLKCVASPGANAHGVEMNASCFLYGMSSEVRWLLSTYRQGTARAFEADKPGNTAQVPHNKVYQVTSWRFFQNSQKLGQLHVLVNNQFMPIQQ